MEIGEGVDVDPKLNEGCNQDLGVTELDGVAAGWLSAKKKGRKNRIIEPQPATRKSSRIQDQGITIEKKASKLNPIQNLEASGIPTNSFNVLNNVSFDYLENVAISCGISLGGNPKLQQRLFQPCRCKSLLELPWLELKKKSGKVES